MGTSGTTVGTKGINEVLLWGRKESLQPLSLCGSTAPTDSQLSSFPYECLKMLFYLKELRHDVAQVPNRQRCTWIWQNSKESSPITSLKYTLLS